MPLTLITPKHSFVRFDNQLDGYPLPVFGNVGATFQVMHPSTNTIPYGNAMTVSIVDLSNTVVQDGTGLPGYQVQDYCAWAKVEGVNLGPGSTDFPIIIPAAQPIAAGSYANKAAFLAALQAIDLNATDTVFFQCCGAKTDITFTYNTTETGYVKFYKGLQVVFVDETAPECSFVGGAAIPIDIDKCFKYAIKHGSDIAYSNAFKRMADSEFLTWTTYYGNEDCYDFSYFDDGYIGQIKNKLWLPLYVRHPKYPESRKVYMKSNKQYKVMSASIEKQYEMLTDYLPESIHEKIAVMLSHDNITFYKNSGIKIDSSIFKKDDYDIDWNEKVTEAMAKCNILIPFEGRNSNCEQPINC